MSTDRTSEVSAEIEPIHSAYAMLQWACASIGAILATINPAYKLQELVRRRLKLPLKVFVLTS